MRYLLVFLCLFLAGCVQQATSKYVEGTDISIGLMIPFDGQLFGVQAFHYVSGKVYSSATTNMQLKTQHSITNSAFGCSTSDFQSSELEVK